jgi:catechol-2,3-dioxygenase
LAVIGFGHYNLRAPRALLEELRAFYCDVVGLAQGPRPPFSHHGFWLYAGAADVLHLSESRPGEARATDVMTTFDHAAFRCAGRSGVEQRLRLQGIPFRTGTVPGTGCVQLFLRDPAGNGVELSFPEG